MELCDEVVRTCAYIVDGVVACAQVYDDGSEYHGGWLRGEWHGQGRLTLASGEVYTGEWVHAEREGYGTQTLPDGCVYSGEWRQGLRHGLGREVLPGGAVYHGTYNLGVRMEGTLDVVEDAGRRPGPGMHSGAADGGMKGGAGVRSGGGMLRKPEEEMMRRLGLESGYGSSSTVYGAGGGGGAAGRGLADRLLGPVPRYRSSTGEGGLVADEGDVQVYMEALQRAKSPQFESGGKASPSAHDSRGGLDAQDMILPLSPDDDEEEDAGGGVAGGFQGEDGRHFLASEWQDPFYKGPTPSLSWGKGEGMGGWGVGKGGGRGDAAPGHVVTLSSVQPWSGGGAIGLIEGERDGAWRLEGIQERAVSLDSRWAEEGVYDGPLPSYSSPRGQGV